MEACYEYLGCDKAECIMHGRKDTKCCWEIEGTLCNHPGIKIVRGETAGKKKRHVFVRPASTTKSQEVGAFKKQGHCIGAGVRDTLLTSG